MSKFKGITLVTTALAALSLAACSDKTETTAPHITQNDAMAAPGMAGGAMAAGGMAGGGMAAGTVTTIYNPPNPAPTITNVGTKVSPNSPNYLVMIGDDIGLEALSCYNIGTDTAYTPNLDKLCNDGLRFDNFYVQPACSPTRTTMMTGQYGFANGVGVPIPPLENIDWNLPGSVDDSGPDLNAPADQETLTPGIAPDAYTFVHALEADIAKDYQTAAIGKWHLADMDNGMLENPNRVGFDYFEGPVRGGGVITYHAWSKAVNAGPPVGAEGYVTSATVNDGLKWLDSIPDGKPWFIWMAFNAPHTPFHMPPKELLQSETAKAVDPATATDLQKYRAMIEAMDKEIGRLLDGLDAETRANTYVMFIGDNGTPGQVATEPFRQGRAKGSIYRGGINVPMFLTGPGVKNGTTPALSNGVDLFATVADISNLMPDAKAPTRPFHSVSLAPVLLEDSQQQVREFAFSDWYGPRRTENVDLQTIRNVDFKVVSNRMAQTQELYDLRSDPNELTDLLAAGELSGEAKTALAELNSQLETLMKTAN